MAHSPHSVSCLGNWACLWKSGDREARLLFTAFSDLNKSSTREYMTGLDGSTWDWLFAAVLMTSCSPSTGTIFVCLPFMAIHLAMALVIASNLDCSIGFAFSINSISVGWWQGLQLADVINWSPALNECLVHKWYARKDALRWHLNSH